MCPRLILCLPPQGPGQTLILWRGDPPVGVWDETFPRSPNLVPCACEGLTVFIYELHSGAWRCDKRMALKASARSAAAPGSSACPGSVITDTHFVSRYCCRATAERPRGPLSPASGYCGGEDEAGRWRWLPVLFCWLADAAPSSAKVSVTLTGIHVPRLSLTLRRCSPRPKSTHDFKPEVSSEEGYVISPGVSAAR